MTYTFVKLGYGSQPAAINIYGEVAGTSVYNGEAISWSPSGAATELNFDGFAVAINTAGDVLGVGWEGNGEDGGYAATVWSPTGQATYLNNAGGTGYGGNFVNSNGPETGASINREGASCGWSRTNASTGANEAVYWSPDGASTVLASLGSSGSNGQQDYGYSLSNTGLIGGVSDNQAVLWSDTGSILWHGDSGSEILQVSRNGSAAVGYDGNSPASWTESGVETLLQTPDGEGGRANAVNNHGQSVGWFVNGANGQPEAALWSSTGAVTVLNDLPDAVSAFAAAINYEGDSVGYCETQNGSEATFWSPTGKATNLAAFLGPNWSDTEANGINAEGDICGYGIYKGHSEGFLFIRSPGAASDVFTVEPYADASIPHLLTASHAQS